MGILFLRSSASVGGGGGDNDGLIITDFANFDPDDAQIISVDVNDTLPFTASTGASVTFDDEAWWNGTTGVCTMVPPTISDAYSGISGINLWKNATKDNKQINIRWEYMVSTAFCQDGINHPKFMILRVYPNFSVGTPGTPMRPMLFLENMQESGNPSIDLDDTLFMCVSQGTERMFSSTNITPGPELDDRVDGGSIGPATYCSMPQPFYHRATSGTDGSGNPILASTEIVCIEQRVNVVATAGEPAGIHAVRVYRRNGQVFERGAAWNWGTGYTLDGYIADIDVFAGGYYNGANSADPNLWTKCGRRITFGFNLQPTVGRAWLGPPTGFVE